MNSTCPAGVDVEQLRSRVTTKYERVARQPDGGFHFRTGEASVDVVVSEPRLRIRRRLAARTQTAGGNTTA